MTRSEESYQVCVCVCACVCVRACVCVCVCLIVCDLETSKRGGLGPSWAAVSQKNITSYETEVCVSRLILHDSGISL